jgi:hypothetical protein
MKVRRDPGLGLVTEADEQLDVCVEINKLEVFSASLAPTEFDLIICTRM